MISRSGKSQQKVLNIVGSSTFGRYPKISTEKSLNFFISDDWIVPYSGYKKALSDVIGGSTQSGNGRGLYVSQKLSKMIAVRGNGVYLIDIFYDQDKQKALDSTVTLIGNLETASGNVYITENNKPQIVISDSVNIYVYDPLQAVVADQFYLATGDGLNPSTVALGFTPGYLDFHDSYVLCAASNDTTAVAGSSLPVSNSWRLSAINDTTGRLYFPPVTASNGPASIGFLQTKPDKTQAVVRFPSRGNVVLVMGKTVCEPWMDVGYQIFPYQRSNSSSYDYGCLSRDTIASNDQMIVWLGINEKTGPIILMSEGGNPEKITTDGLDYLLSQMQAPEDSAAFLYRQDGHNFYHINFYTDNVSLFYDFNTKKFYHASDENGNYFKASFVVFFNNQYYFLSKDDGYLYALDTIFTTYDGKEIPRVRTCKNIRLPTQEYFSVTDAGFTIEQGTTNPQQDNIGPGKLVYQNGNNIIAQGVDNIYESQDGFPFETQDDQLLIAQNQNTDFFSYLITNHDINLITYPRVDLSISIDGGYSFSSYMPYNMNALGKRKNKLQWWQLGLANDITCQFRFSGLGRFVATDGILNLRQ